MVIFPGKDRYHYNHRSAIRDQIVKKMFNVHQKSLLFDLFEQKSVCLFKAKIISSPTADALYVQKAALKQQPKTKNQNQSTANNLLLISRANSIKVSFCLHVMQGVGIFCVDVVIGAIVVSVPALSAVPVAAAAGADCASAI